MLSVPPAFILSQDQTLNLIRSLLLGLELTGIFITVPFILFSLDKVFFFSDVTLFDFQSSARSFVPFGFARSAWLSYHIVFDLSTTFFKFFSIFFDAVRLARTGDIISYRPRFVNDFF